MTIAPPPRPLSRPAPGPANDASPSTAPQAPPPPWCHEPDWQKLWLSTQLAPYDAWRSLALVPADPSLTPTQLAMIAQGLAFAGTVHLRTRVYVADGTNVGLDRVMEFGQEIEDFANTPNRLIIPLAPVSKNLTTVTLAHMADACLLCVLKHQTRRKDMQATFKSIGASRFIGAAVFHAPTAKRK